MTGTSARASTLPDGGSPSRPRRFRAVRGLVVVVALAAVAFGASALLPGSHARSASPFSVRRAVHVKNTKDALPERVTTVLGSSTPASQYGQADSARENQGVNLKGQMTSDLTPLPASAFTRPIALYRRYAERWAATFATAVARLQATLGAGDRAAAESAWNTAFFDFMHLGADYNLLPTGLTDQLAQVPSRLGEKRFPGLHRIEMGLWTHEPLDSLLPVAAGVATASRKLERILPTVRIQVLAYTLRIHEILEDAQRDLLSGTDVPWSGAGVLGTEAGLIATRELLATVQPVVEARDNGYGESESWLDQLQRVLLSVRRANGSWPTNRQLTMAERERINGVLAGTLSALEQVPQALETPAHAITGFPSIPKRRGLA